MELSETIAKVALTALLLVILNSYCLRSYWLILCAQAYHVKYLLISWHQCRAYGYHLFLA